MKLKKNFHPRVFGLAGFSGCGKTTLIEKLIGRMKHFRIGYIKHDAHQFTMDHEGKDTYRQYAAGAQMVFINDPFHFSFQVKGESFSLEKEFFKDCDFILVEGHKYADHPKLLFLDREGVAQKEYSAGKISEIVATVSCDEETFISGLPSFHRDDVDGIVSFLESKIHASVTNVELQGLVLAGGKSSRMGLDKAMLDYHGKPQALHLIEAMEALNIKSYLSCRAEQLNTFNFRERSVITDRFLDFGPLGGIVSAMSNFPDKAWLVVACDLPFVSYQRMKELISSRDPLKQATAFFNQDRKQFEPLFAIYEPSIYSRMLHFLGEGVQCPQKVLFNSSIKKLLLKSQSFLANANSPEERDQILLQLERISI